MEPTGTTSTDRPDGWMPSERELQALESAPHEEDPTGARHSMDPMARRDYQAMLSAAEQALQDVERALARLDDGTYGTCEVCSALIPDADLEVTPTARWCDSHLPLDATNGR